MPIRIIPFGDYSEFLLLFKQKKKRLKQAYALYDSALKWMKVFFLELNISNNKIIFGNFSDVSLLKAKQAVLFEMHQTNHVSHNVY